MVRAEEIIFWILILVIIGIAIWLAFGSPGFETSLISIVIFVAISEILLWKFLFSYDKKTSLGFEKVKLEFKSMNNKLENIGNNINEIRDSLMRKKRK